MFEFGTNPIFDEEPLRIRLLLEVSTSPTVNAIAPVSVFSPIVRSVMLLMPGASLTAFTVRMKVSLSVRLPSLTVTMMVALPD